MSETKNSSQDIKTWATFKSQEGFDCRAIPEVWFQTLETLKTSALAMIDKAQVEAQVEAQAPKIPAISTNPKDSHNSQPMILPNAPLFQSGVLILNHIVLGKVLGVQISHDPNGQFYFEFFGLEPPDFDNNVQRVGICDECNQVHAVGKNNN